MNDIPRSIVGLTSSPVPAGARRLPHHRLVVYSVAVSLLHAVRGVAIRDPKLRDEATRSAKSACLNTAEEVLRIADRLVALLTGPIR